jgi:hypothetical protein
MQHRFAYLLAAVLCALASACEGSSDEGAAGSGGDVGPVQALGEELGAIYEITEHRTNQETCEPGGAQVAGHGFLAIFTLASGPFAQVRAISCEGVDGCRESVDAATHGRSFSANFSFVFDDTSGDNTLLGTDTVAVREGEICYRKLTDAVLERTDDSGLRIEARFWRGEIYMPSAGEACSATEGEDPTMDEPCIELETLSATRAAEIEP